MPEFVDIGNFDFLAKSASLRRHGFSREFFDATNPKHIESMKHYMETGNWLQQFYAEDPYTDVPMTVLRKYAGHQLGILVTTVQKLDAGVISLNLLAGPKEFHEITQKRA